MTMVLAVAYRDVVVMCADTKVKVTIYEPGKPPRDEYQADRKLFLCSNCAIATYGNGPANDPVPRAIDNDIPQDLQSPADVAQALLDRFHRGTPPPNMHAFVGGFVGDIPWLYAVDIAQKRATPLFDEFGKGPRIRANRQIASGRDEIGETPEATLERMLDVEREEARRSEDVGPPYDHVILRPNQEPHIERTDDIT